MEVCEVIHLRGSLRIILGDLDGNIVKEINVHNLAVTQGRSWVLGQLITPNHVTSQNISHMAVGSGTVAPVTGDTALGGEVTRVAVGTWVTSTLTANPPTWQAQISLATNEANTTLGEVGLFNSSASGTMLARATYASFVKATSNTLAISYNVSD